MSLRTKLSSAIACTCHRNDYTNCHIIAVQLSAEHSVFHFISGSSKFECVKLSYKLGKITIRIKLHSLLSGRVLATVKQSAFTQFRKF